MPNLRSANLSRNHLLEASDAALSGAGGGCQARNLASLDLSSNQLTTLERGELAQAASTLEELDLSYNRISILGMLELDRVPRFKEIQVQATKPTESVCITQNNSQ